MYRSHFFSNNQNYYFYLQVFINPIMPEKHQIPCSTQAGMNKAVSSRIQSSQTRTGHNTGQSTFSASAQSAGDRNSGSDKSSGNNKK
jgi:hypothetical protein